MILQSVQVNRRHYSRTHGYEDPRGIDKTKALQICWAFYLVREKGLEPSRLAALAPKASVSTNSTTAAHLYRK